MRARARLVTLLGVLVALAGLSGYWLTRDVQRASLSEDQRRLLGLEEDEFHASFVVAGRDIAISYDRSEPVYGEGGRIVAWRPVNLRTSAYGTNTDTILYVNIQNDDITMIAIPRDIWLDDLVTRVNAVYAYRGAEGLRSRVEAILGVPVEYYAIVNIDMFKKLVDALGGVTVDVPYRMYHRDNAAGLLIDFQPGIQHLDGEAASKFIRFRNTLRGDIDRIDNVKRLAFAMLQRLKELNVRAVTVVPNLVETFLSDVETNASPALVRQLAARVPNLRLVATATVPVHEVEGKGYVRYDPAEVQAFIAQTFGGVARDFSAPPEQGLLVTDRSGVPGLGQAYVDALVAAGVPAELVTLREDGGSEPGPTRLLATLDAWSDADYYAELLHASKQQVDRMAPYGGRAVKLELVLGSDAAERIDHDRALMASVATTVAAGAEER